MDAPTFLPYDSRNPHLHQRHMPQQYVVGPPYNSATMPSSAPAPPPAPPHHHHHHPPPHPHQYSNQQAFAYVPYQSPPPSTPIGSPYKHDVHQRPALGQRMPPPPDADAARHVPFRRGSKPLSEARRQSPSARSESQASSTARSMGSNNPTANSKTITYNETINPADRINFETDVDELMKAIQTKDEDEDDIPVRGQAPTPAQTPGSDSVSGPQSPVRPPSPSRSQTKSKKKWVCDGPSCNKRFVQKTHLDIHRRTHTGLKPYVCTKDNCGLTFSQRGNLKTHMRRHTGEKPFSCSICGKLFAQRGNVRSHEETHKGLKPFICRLDDCHKTFSQLGNMKTHQNNFHKETLQRLTNMFIKCAQMGEIPDEHQELFEYFKAHYKNSNKGIKGRGKARTVAPKAPKNDGHSQQQYQQHPPQSQQHAQHSPQQTQPQQPPPPLAFPHHLPMPNPQQPPQSTYLPGPAGPMGSIPRHAHHHHHHHHPSMFDPPQHPSSNGGGAAGMLYEDEHARQLAFSTERLYQ
ncbi:hypothetical protein CDD80_519 [Ophiocordyceps camponoti-rufipedis]|uniref:C2H2-type domain-containing protein n=1 Tax=Ophiocordyceps camponoti-rufipedis TaxID=2004952 RepID=A0A2C5YE74_9HYPO|nr:hypothetical protein CDD80_519 [Ophiocordyceps camponoti-rufipedis]